MQEELLLLVRRFANLVEAAELHGLAFQHLALCPRRAWLHLHRIDYAHLDDRMARGSALHDTAKPRDRSVEGLMGLSPDRIDWERRQVFEAKGGAGAREAVSRQSAFYALLLWAAQGHPWRAAIDILPSKRTREVVIDGALVRDMLEAARALTALHEVPTPPSACRMQLCDACSYRFLCGFA